MVRVSWILRNTMRVFAAIVLAIFVAPACTRAQASSQEALARFPVAHEHGNDWCLGYLYIYPDSIAYEVTWPAAMKSHSFDLKLSSIQQVARWTASGQSLNAIELKIGSSLLHFWWLANEQDVLNGRAYQFNPPDAGDPTLLISAIRNPASLNSPPPAALAQQNAPPQQMPSFSPGTAQPPQAPQSPAAQYVQPSGSQTTPAAEQPMNPSTAQETRFAVVHSHAVGQCAGYLYISATRVRYEALQPQNDKKHSFDIARTEISGVQQWILMGRPLNALEVRTAHAIFHFWLLPDNADVANTPPNRWGPNNVIAPNPLFAALQGQAPGSPQSPALSANSYGAEPPATAPMQPQQSYAPTVQQSAYGAPTQQNGFNTPAQQDRFNVPPQQNGFGAVPSNNFSAQQQPPPTGAASLAQYQYTPPPGWTPHQYPDGITLVAPTSNTGENCQITMWPMRSSTGNLQNDGDTAFREVFKAFEPRTQTSYGDQIDLVEARGTSGQGWDYLIEKRGIGLPRNARQTFETLQGWVFVANLNGTVAVVSGISKPSLVSACFGELINDVWPDFFYNLKFKSWAPVDTSSALIQQLAGTWTVATATVADQFTFTANGRYGGASAAQQYNLAGDGTVLTTTQGYFGDGAYTVNGNAMLMTPDNKSRQPTNALFRIEQETKDGGRSWTPILYLSRISTVDGKEYEVRYKKTR